MIYCTLQQRGVAWLGAARGSSGRLPGGVLKNKFSNEGKVTLFFTQKSIDSTMPCSMNADDIIQNTCPTRFAKEF